MFRKIKHLIRAAGKNKLSITTNIAGLSIGLAATILLVVFILHEWSYDRHFSKADNIYRLNSIWIDNGKPTVHPINLRKAFTQIPSQVPGIEKTVQIYRGWTAEISFNNTRFANNNLLLTDSTFFDLFDFKAVEGKTQNALMNPNSMVLTKKTAHKIFGEQSAIGQVLQMDSKTYTVSAVIEDVPANTHFKFDLLVPMKSLGHFIEQMQGLEFFTYYLYNSNVDAQNVSQAICTINTKIMEDQFKSFNSVFSSEIEPLKQLHLRSKAMYDLGPQGSIKTVILVGIIAFLVMFLAFTNFVNLFIIEGEQRSKEIGIRKVLGGSTTKMLMLIYSNSLKWTAIAAVITIPLSYFVLHNWVQSYAVKAPLSWWLFAQGVIIILVLETLITLGQTWRAATRNPVEALRYE